MAFGCRQSHESENNVTLRHPFTVFTWISLESSLDDKFCKQNRLLELRFRVSYLGKPNYDSNDSDRTIHSLFWRSPKRGLMAWRKKHLLRCFRLQKFSPATLWLPTDFSDSNSSKNFTSRWRAQCSHTSSAFRLVSKGRAADRIDARCWELLSFFKLKKSSNSPPSFYPLLTQPSWSDAWRDPSL